MTQAELPAADDRMEQMEDFLRTEFAPTLRRAMYGVAAISAMVGAATALFFLFTLAAAR